MVRPNLMRTSVDRFQIQCKNLTNPGCRYFPVSHGEGTLCLTMISTKNNRSSSITKNRPLMPPSIQTIVCTRLTKESRTTGHDRYGIPGFPAIEPGCACGKTNTGVF